MIYLLSVTFSIMFLIATIYVVRRKKLSLTYALLWFVLALVVLFLALGGTYWNYAAHQIGIYYAPALLFLSAILFILVYIFRLTITVTNLSYQNVRLIQELSILKVRIQELEDN